MPRNTNMNSIPNNILAVIAAAFVATGASAQTVLAPEAPGATSAVAPVLDAPGGTPMSVDDANEAIQDLFDQDKYKDSRGNIVSDLDDGDVERLRKTMEKALGRPVSLEEARVEAQRLGRHVRRGGAGWKSKVGLGAWDHAGHGEVGVYAESIAKEQLLKENPGSKVVYSSPNSQTGAPAQSSDMRVVHADGRVKHYNQVKATNNAITNFQQGLQDMVAFSESRANGAPAPIKVLIPDDHFDDLLKRGKINPDGSLTELGKQDMDLEAKKLALNSGDNGARAKDYDKNATPKYKAEVKFAKIGKTYPELEAGAALVKAQYAKQKQELAARNKAAPANGQQKGTRKVSVASRRSAASPGAVRIVQGAGAGFGALQIYGGLGVLMDPGPDGESDAAMARRMVVGGSHVAAGTALMATALPAISNLSSVAKFSRGAGVVAIPLIAVAELAVFSQYYAGDISWPQYRRHLFEASGGLGGGALGAWGGAAAGAAIGSAVPGIGTAVGAVGGMVIGGVAGAFAGAALTTAGHDAIYGSADPP